MVVGGSPIASPVSRHAIATRVTESTISSTSRPASRKYSATAVATSAPVARTTADWSLVATTTTERREPFGPEVALDELAHLASALAEQRDHVDVGAGAPGDHAEQHALADAAARHDADPLAPAERDQAVDGPDAGAERRPMRVRSSGFGGSALRG